MLSPSRLPDAGQLRSARSNSKISPLAFLLVRLAPVLVLALVIHGSAPLLAADEGVPAADLLEITSFDSVLPVSQYVYKSVIPQGTLDSVEGIPTIDFFSQVTAEIERQGYSGQSALDLNWERNTDRDITINSPSQFTLLALDLINTTSETDFLMEIQGPHAVAWHYIDAQGQPVVHVDNFDEPLAGRPVFDTRPVIPLHLEPRQHYRFLVVVYVMTQQGQVRMNVWNPEAFRAQRSQQHLIDGAYLGFVVAVIIASLVLAIAFRKTIYLSFALFLASSAMLIYLGSGVAALYGLGSHLSLSVPLFTLSFGLAGVFSALFSMQLLDMKNTNRILYHAYRGFIAYATIAVIVSTWLSTPEAPSIAALNIILVLSSIGFVVTQLGHLYTLFHYLRKSPIVLFWYAAMAVHWWALIAWTVAISTTVQFGMDLRYLAQLAMVVDILLLLGLMVYIYRTERRKHMEAERRSIESLRLAHDLERSKLNFCATVGHDLRSPLQAISHFTQALKGGQPEVSRPILGKIDENVKTISALLDSMLNLSRIEGRSENMVLETFALRPLLFELRTEFSSKAAAKGLSLEFNVQPSTVHSDRICLGQVLRNLVDNAIKYTREGYVRVTAETHGNAVHIVIEDSGMGIPPHELNSIFREFYRGAGASGTSGVGLGLSIVARLTKLLGIEVTVRSRHHEYTRFELRVPKTVTSGDDDSLDNQSENLRTEMTNKVRPV